MFLDPTLTVESLVGVMEKVISDEERRRKVWKTMLKMDYVYDTLSSSYLDEVYLKYSTAEEKTRALADVYVNSRPRSSWQHLVQILYCESEMAAAKEAKPFLQQQIGGLRVTCKLCTLFICIHISICCVEYCDCPLIVNSMTLQFLRISTYVGLGQTNLITSFSGFQISKPMWEVAFFLGRGSLKSSV